MVIIQLSWPLRTCESLTFPPVQWLKQIECTESAITQKMIDLENDTVNNHLPLEHTVFVGFDGVTLGCKSIFTTVKKDVICTTHCVPDSPPFTRDNICCILYYCILLQELFRKQKGFLEEELDYRKQALDQSYMVRSPEQYLSHCSNDGQSLSNRQHALIYFDYNINQGCIQGIKD